MPDRPKRLVPWWQLQTTQRRRTMQASQFRRDAEANVFNADTRDRESGTLGDMVRRGGDENRRPFASEDEPKPVTWGGPRSNAYGDPSGPAEGRSTSAFRQREQAEYAETQSRNLRSPISTSLRTAAKHTAGFLGGSPTSNRVDGSQEHSLLPEGTPKLIEYAVEEAGRPINYIPLLAPIRGVAAGLKGSRGIAARAIGNLLEPAARGSLRTQAAGEVALAATGHRLAEGGAEEAAERTDNKAVQTAAGLTAALLGAGAGMGAGTALRSGARNLDASIVRGAVRDADPTAPLRARGDALYPRARLAGGAVDYRRSGPLDFEATPLSMLNDLEELPPLEDLAARIVDIERQLEPHRSRATGDVLVNATTRKLMERRGQAEALGELRRIYEAADGDVEKAGNYLLEALDEHQNWEASRTVNRGSVRGRGAPDANTGQRTNARDRTVASDAAGAPAEPIEVLRARSQVLNDVYGALVEAKSLDDVLAPVRRAKAGLEEAPAATSAQPPVDPYIRGTQVALDQPVLGMPSPASAPPPARVPAPEAAPFAQLEAAATGQPLNLTGYREGAPGSYYAADPKLAEQYRGSGPSNLITEQLDFQNPLVAPYKDDVLRAWQDDESLDPAVREQARALLDQLEGRAPGGPAGVADAFLEQQARAQGYDGIVFKDATTPATSGVDAAEAANYSEIVDLRQPASSPVPRGIATPDEAELHGIPAVREDLDAIQARLDSGETPREAFVDAAAPDGGAGGGAGGRPPLTPPGSAGGRGGGRGPRKPTTPVQALEAITRRRLPGEKVDNALLRLHEGAINEMEGEVRVLMDAGNDRLQALGLGVRRGGRLVMREQDIEQMDELYTALHNPSAVDAGEIVVPPHLEAVYHELRGLTDWEQAARIDFDPSTATVEDYFYRGWWKDQSDTGQRGAGQLGRTPGFRKQRIDSSYAAMRAEGYQPASWNPFEQWAFSRRMGERYRHQMTLIDSLKALGVAHPHAGGAVPKGFRVPRIGPAFEGKAVAFLDKQGESSSMRTRQWIVDSSTANRLENVYGVGIDLGTVNIGSRQVDVLKAMDAAVFIPKRIKLLASFFQHQDFGTRNALGHFTHAVDDLAHGRPWSSVKDLARIPKSSLDLVRANFDPSTRRTLRQQLMSEEGLIEGRPGVNFRAMVRAGLSTADQTIFTRDMEHVVGEVVKEGVKDKLLAAPRAVAAVNRFFQDGLFEGVYPSAITSDIKNNIAPMLAKQFPELTDEALNGLIAKTANTKYSTIPASQSVIQNRFVRETLRRVLFSTNEAEALLRQMTGMVHGNNKAFWVKNTIGTYVGLLATAELIHFASTGEALPADRFTPISKDGFGPLPFGYNRDFMSPNIPLTGRSGAQLSLDLVGQLDTAFRILDPAGFLASRESVPVRAISTQLMGEDFQGNAIDQVGPKGIYSRTMNLAFDLFAPIGVGQASAQMARERAGETGRKLIPAGEARVGDTGAAIQALGGNVRAETNAQIRDRLAQQSGYTSALSGKPATKWEDLTGLQKEAVLKKNPDLADELRTRSKEGAEVGSAYPLAEQARADIDRRRLEGESVLGKRLAAGTLEGTTPYEKIGGLTDAYHDLQLESAAAKQQANKDFGVFQETGELPKHPGQRAYVEYLAAFEKAEGPDRVMDPDDWEELDRIHSQLEKSAGPAAWRYVEERKIAEHAPELAGWLAARKVVADSDYWELPDKVLASAEGRSLVPRGVTAHRTRDLVVARDTAARRGDDRLVEDLEAALKDIDSIASDLKRDYREQHPQIDRALTLGYGLKPIGEQESGGLGRSRSSSSTTRERRSSGTTRRATSRSASGR